MYDYKNRNEMVDLNTGVLSIDRVKITDENNNHKGSRKKKSVLYEDYRTHSNVTIIMKKN